MKRAIFSTLYWGCWILIWLYVPFRKSARLLVVKNGTYLVIKPYFGNGMWQLAGGGRKRGESPQDTAVREVKEELGIDVTAVQPLLPIQHYYEQGMFLRYEIFVATCSDDAQIVLNHEVAEYAWLDREDVAKALPHVQMAVRANDEAHLLQ